MAAVPDALTYIREGDFLHPCVDRRRTGTRIVGIVYCISSVLESDLGLAEKIPMLIKKH